SEVGLELHPAVLMHRDVARVASGPGAEECVVRRGEADLDREEDREPAALDQVEDAAYRLGSVRARDRVLHLGEAHEPRVRVDAVAAVDARGAARERADGARDPRRQRRRYPPDAAE